MRRSDFSRPAIRHDRGEAKPMDQQLIAEKLESLRRCVERIRTRCPDQALQLASDPALQDNVEDFRKFAAEVSRGPS
jgi:hypothetical protein